MIKAAAAQAPVDNLRNALQVLAQFSHRNRQLLMRIMADALAGETVALDFLRANVPRHLGVLATLIAAAQRDGRIVAAPLPQIVAFLGGAVIAPVLVGSALLEHGAVPAPMAAGFDGAVLSEQAASQRIEFALRGLAPATEGAP